MKFFNWFGKEKAPPCCKHAGTRRVLSECKAGERGMVISNPDHRMAEMGFTHGARVQVIHNDASDENMVATVGESRVAIPKGKAANIIMCAGGGKEHLGKGTHTPCSAK